MTEPTEAYEAPELVVLGTVHDLTLGDVAGPESDGPFHFGPSGSGTA